MPHISVVSPVYRAQEIIPELIERIERSLKKITNDYEIILVEDCGPDQSWEEIERIAEGNTKIIGVKLSRNFGQHYAITAGLDLAKSDWVVVMDCDLQDQPEEIEKLYTKALEGYDVVLAKRFERKDSFIKKTFSKYFFKVLSYLTGTTFDFSVANFGIYSNKVISNVIKMRENIRVFPIMINWMGFNTAKINIEHAPRPSGVSSYSIGKLLNLAIDIILAYSDKPIRLLTKTGIFISAMSILVALVYFIKWLRGEVEVLGYTSLIISLWLLSGFIISTLGIVGLYVGKIFEGVKQRPIYIIDKKIN